MYNKFQGCKVDVQDGTLIINNPRANPVISCSLYQYALYGVSNIPNKLQCCTVDVHATTTICNNARANLVTCVYT